MKNIFLAITLLLVAPVQMLFAADSTKPVPAMHFITLGTASGPDSIPNRSQPANALVTENSLYLVDAGDGAVQQLAKAGRRLPEVDGLFLSHLHFDHSAGVLGVLGLRMQMEEKKTLNIYGPPGTKTFVDGLLAGMNPAMNAGYGLPRPPWQPNIAVHELRNGAMVELENLTVKVVENSHYQNQQHTQDTPGYISLSFRFDGANRSIVFTGDTGPSTALEELAKRADLLVSEMMDIPLSLANIKRINPNMDENTLRAIETHFRAHHITPEQVAAMAATADVKALVITHFAPGAATPAQAQHYRELMQNTFKGTIDFANDLDRF